MISQGITFTAITLRISLRSADSTSKRSITSNARGGMPADSQFGTVGTIPMRHSAINVTKDVEAHGSSDGTSFVDFDKSLDGKKEPIYAE